ncbi:MAG: hypothetical protein J7497_06135 [Chitinophagaceae bacterium]|nr:hypothetical protein [Chitinophagaceae bacterium]
MKSLLFAGFFVALSISGMAQTSDAEADAMINLLGIQKKEAIAKLVLVEPKDSAAFWKLYDEYQKKNAPIAKNRLQLYETTARHYTNLEDASADSLAKKFFENRFNQEKSLEEYYKKIKAATNATTAFSFYQAEVYLLTNLRAQIMQQIPTYGQFKAMLKRKE